MHIGTRTPLGFVLAVIGVAALVGTSCSITHEIATTDFASTEATTQDTSAAEATTDLADANGSSASSSQAGLGRDTVPETLAYANEPTHAPELCPAVGNVWMHSTSINLLGRDATPEMVEIALLNVDEWLSRAALHDPAGETPLNELAEAFTDVEAIVGEQFNYDWMTYRAGSDDGDESLRRYELEREHLVAFLTDQCPDVDIINLTDEAMARADELITTYGRAETTVTESDLLPGFSIFTHGSGRLIASFPSDWAHDERTPDHPGAVVDITAADDLSALRAGRAIDGFRLQLIEADMLADFEDALDATATARMCTRTGDDVNDGRSRIDITQTFECGDHGATIIGQYRPETGTGLVLEATFADLPATRTDLSRLTMVSNSILWS